MIFLNLHMQIRLLDSHPALKGKGPGGGGSNKHNSIAGHSCLTENNQVKKLAVYPSQRTSLNV